MFHGEFCTVNITKLRSTLRIILQSFSFVFLIEVHSKNQKNVEEMKQAKPNTVDHCKKSIDTTNVGLLPFHAIHMFRYFVFSVVPA